jgi:hypothetical protein
MAYRQIAMLACIEDHLTPLMTVKDDFSAVVISGLEDGGDVSVEVEGCSAPFGLCAGINPFSEEWKGRFALRKVAGPSPRPTSVEIIRGGK